MRIIILSVLLIVVAASGCVNNQPEAISDPAQVNEVVESKCYRNGWVKISTFEKTAGLGGDGDVSSLSRKGINKTIQVVEDPVYLQASNFDGSIAFQLSKNLKTNEKYSLDIQARGGVREKAKTCIVKNTTFNP